MPRKHKPTIKSNGLVFNDGETNANTSIKIGSPAWFEWLSDNNDFIYEGSAGRFTARRELRRGIGYWYGHRRRDGKLSKVYLGKSKNLTQERLEQACSRLAGQIPIEQLLSKGNPAASIPELSPQIKGSVPSNDAEISLPLVPLAKVKSPAFLRNHTPRPRLIQRIFSPVTLICAPAGYGKTTTLNEWRRDCGMQVVWVALDQDDNNLQRFWSTMVTALQMINSNAGQDWLSLLYTASTSDLTTIVINFINEIIRVIEKTKIPKGIGFVLDNYHLIQNPDIHASIQTFLEQFPPKMKLVIASQTKPPLDMRHLRSKGMLVELGVDDLRFSLEEGIAFLSQHKPAENLAYSDLHRLVKHAEGWITGLLFAITALSQEEDPSGFVERFTSAHPYLREFFTENVLNRKPPEVQAFLLKTSILKRLTGSLCDAVTGRDDGTEMLAQLWDERLFLEPLVEMDSYRYHDWFAEMLQSELKRKFPADVLRLHREAANWYSTKNARADTIHHLLASEAWEDAVALIEKVAQQELSKFGEGPRLFLWLQQLPEPVLYQSKALLVLYISLAMLSLPITDVERFLVHTEVKIASLSSLGVAGSAQEALSEIYKIHRLWMTNDRSSSESHLDNEQSAMYQLMDEILLFHRDCRRDLVQAEKKASVIYETAQAKGHLFAILIAGGACANLAFSQGHLRRSEQIAHQVLQEAFKLSGKLPEPAVIPLAILSGVHYERNQMDQAHRLLVRAEELNTNATSSNEPVMLAILRAKIQSALGDNNAAFVTIQSIRELHTQHPSSIWLDQDLAAYQALFLLQLGDLTVAERYLNQPEGSDTHGFSDLVRAAILIEQNRYVAAEELLRNLLDQYPHGFYWLPILRAQVMLSIALFNQHKVNQARQIIAEAARLAAPEFFVRPFLVSGPKIVSLLSLILHTENLNEGIRSFLKGTLTQMGYADGVLNILPQEQTEAFSIAASITPREQHVLRLLTASLSNREIAEQCSISPSTVKTHLENIYRKLGVNSRTQAVEKVRLLNLV